MRKSVRQFCDTMRIPASKAGAMGVKPAANFREAAETPSKRLRVERDSGYCEAANVSRLCCELRRSCANHRLDPRQKGQRGRSSPLKYHPTTIRQKFQFSGYLTFPNRVRVGLTPKSFRIQSKGRFILKRTAGRGCGSPSIQRARELVPSQNNRFVNKPADQQKIQDDRLIG